MSELPFTHEEHSERTVDWAMARPARTSSRGKRASGNI